MKNKIHRRPRWLRNTSLFVKYYEMHYDLMDEAYKTNDVKYAENLIKKSKKCLEKSAKWFGFRSSRDMFIYCATHSAFKE